MNMYKGPARTLTGSIVITQPRSGSVPKKKQRAKVIKITIEWPAISNTSKRGLKTGHRVTT